MKGSVANRLDENRINLGYRSITEMLIGVSVRIWILSFFLFFFLNALNFIKDDGQGGSALPIGGAALVVINALASAVFLYCISRQIANRNPIRKM